MKKLLPGIVFVLVSTTAALAADPAVKAPARVYQPTSAYNWSGLYIGAHAGYGWGENKISDFFLGGGKLEPAGGFGGVQLGYNEQFAPHWLIGGVVDFSAGDLEDSATLPGSIIAAKNKFDFFGTARTRFGYVQDRWLVYGTAGAIWLRDKYTSRWDLGLGLAFTGDASQYHVGWVFGGGVEYAVDDRWSWNLEYLYAPLDRSYDSAAGRSWDPNLSIVRAGLNYRFGGTEASTGHAMPVKAVASRPEWNGSYLGVHGGYGWAKLNENLAGFEASLKPDGGYGGFQGGYNWLFAPNALLGIEVDSSYGDLEGNGVYSLLKNPIRGKIESLGTARLRLGYLMTPDTLLYVTGGAAYAREKFALPAVPIKTKADHLGWTVGGGVEWKFAPEWSVKAEYLYADLGSFRNDTVLLGTPGPRSSDLALNTVRIGINYSGPVIERLFGAH